MSDQLYLWCSLFI